MSGWPLANVEPGPWTQMTAVRRRRGGSLITPARTTPSRVRTLTSVTGIPTGLTSAMIGALAARVVGDREAQRAGRRVVVDVVAGALEARRAGEQADHGGLVGRPLSLLGLIGAHEALQRGQRGAVGGQPAPI